MLWQLLVPIGAGQQTQNGLRCGVLVVLLAREQNLRKPAARSDRGRPFAAGIGDATSPEVAVHLPPAPHSRAGIIRAQLAREQAGPFDTLRIVAFTHQRIMQENTREPALCAG